MHGIQAVRERKDMRMSKHHGTCKTCMHCRPSYRGGSCSVKGKQVKYSGTCIYWSGKREKERQ